MTFTKRRHGLSARNVDTDTQLFVSEVTYRYLAYVQKMDT